MHGRPLKERSRARRSGVGWAQGPRDERSRAGQRRARARRRRSVAAVWVFKQRQHLSWKPCVASTLPAAAFAAAAPQTPWGGAGSDLCTTGPGGAAARGAEAGWGAGRLVAAVSGGSEGVRAAAAAPVEVPPPARRQQQPCQQQYQSTPLACTRLVRDKKGGGVCLRDGSECSMGCGGGLLGRHCLATPPPLHLVVQFFAPGVLLAAQTRRARRHQRECVRPVSQREVQAGACARRTRRQRTLRT